MVELFFGKVPSKNIHVELLKILSMFCCNVSTWRNVTTLENKCLCMFGNVNFLFVYRRERFNK